jgi:hypothetical protein
MAMDFLCCDPLDGDNDSHSEGSVTCSTDEGILECDYDSQVTKLYHSIEERHWEEVLYFLETGKWYNTSIFSAFGEQGDSPAVQTRTWVTALDEASGNVRWCQLPLHAAVTFLAPFSVISQLLKVYPKSVRCADDQDMLPLHYAFRFGAEDDVLVHLLEQFPQAIGKKAVKDRLPLDLAQYGPRPERGRMVDHYMQSAVRNAKNDWDGEYEKMVSAMKNNADSDLQHSLNLTKDQLSDAVKELSRTKTKMEALQRELDKKESKSIASLKSSRSTGSKSNRSVKRIPSFGKNSINNENKGRKTSTKDEGEKQLRRVRRPSKSVTAKNLDTDSTSTRRGFSQLFSKRK